MKILKNKHPYVLHILVTIALCISLSLLLTAFVLVQQTPCGTERWDVKTLSDKESAGIKWSAVNTSVKAMSQLIQPFPVKDKKFDKKIRFGYEFNVYELKCRIREFRKEDDGDYHLVLVDINDTTCTIVGEIINPDCPEISNSKYLGAFKNTREEFELFKLPKNQVMDGIYTVTGVCFFDFKHNQLGVAPNGVEIHPIMDIVTEIK